MVVYVTFLHDVACQKILNLANISRNYLQNDAGTVFLRHSVCSELNSLQNVYLTFFLF